MFQFGNEFKGTVSQPQDGFDLDGFIDKVQLVLLEQGNISNEVWLVLLNQMLSTDRIEDFTTQKECLLTILEPFNADNLFSNQVIMSFYRGETEAQAKEVAAFTK